MQIADQLRYLLQTISSLHDSVLLLQTDCCGPDHSLNHQVTTAQQMSSDNEISILRTWHIRLMAF